MIAVIAFLSHQQADVKNLVFGFGNYASFIEEKARFAYMHAALFQLGSHAGNENNKPYKSIYEVYCYQGEDKHQHGEVSYLGGACLGQEESAGDNAEYAINKVFHGRFLLGVIIPYFWGGKQGGLFWSHINCVVLQLM